MKKIICDDENCCCSSFGHHGRHSEKKENLMHHVRTINNVDPITEKLDEKDESFESMLKNEYQDRRPVTKKRKTSTADEEKTDTIEGKNMVIRQLRSEMNYLKNELDEKKDLILELQAEVQGLKEEKEDISKMYWGLIVDTHVLN